MKTEAQTYTFRVIEKEYQNRLSYDEGPGSSSSVDATCHLRVIADWEDKPASFGEDLLKYGHSDLSLEEDSDDGYYAYTYAVQRTETGTSRWVWLGNIPSHTNDQ